MSRTGKKIAVIVTVAAVLAAAGVGLSRLMGPRLPDGPLPVAWDREVCAHCRMHVGEPSFAVQLQTSDGRVLHFDDPGCYFIYVSRHQPPVHAVYFHDYRQDRWLARDEVAFVRVPHSPMGYNLGAVDRGTEGALALDEARRQVVASGGGAPAQHHGGSRPASDVPGGAPHPHPMTEGGR